MVRVVEPIGEAELGWCMSRKYWGQGLMPEAGRAVVRYLFNEAGRPDLTQKWVRWTLDQRFSLDQNGLDGNDDCGTLSSWYVFSALGFYPIAGTDRYWLGSPAVKSAALTLENGAVFQIEARNQGPKNVYVSAVYLNGEPVNGVYLTHRQIQNGGTLTFVMTDHCENR